MHKKILGIALVTVLAGLASVSAARADTIIDSGVRFTATVTSTTVSLDIQCLDAAVCGNWYLGDVTLKGFTFTGDPTLGIAPAGYTVQNGGQNNGGVGSGGGCNDTQPGNAVCWQTLLPLTTQLGSGVISFTANITDGEAGVLHVQATAYSNSAGEQADGGKVMAVSADLGTTTVPETSSLVLLGSGLLTMFGLTAISRRRLVTS